MTAVNVATTPGAIYTGLATGNAAGANYLYATDNKGVVWVFDKNFNNSAQEVSNYYVGER